MIIEIMNQYIFIKKEECDTGYMPACHTLCIYLSSYMLMYC